MLSLLVGAIKLLVTNGSPASLSPNFINHKLFKTAIYCSITSQKSCSLFIMPKRTASSQSAEELEPSPKRSKITKLIDDEDPSRGLEEHYEVSRKDLSCTWLNCMGSCYIYLYRGGGEPSGTLAAFDLDGTIIKPKGRSKIPKSATDWEFFSVWTKVKIQQAVRDNRARFVMFTNQNGVGLKIVSLEEVKERIELVAKRLDIPCTVFVATEKDDFRKPNIGMFRLFTKSFNNMIPIEHEKSFYCGDAIGYPSHSDADIKFAQTVGLPFLTPEKFLRGVKPKFLDSIVPKDES